MGVARYNGMAGLAASASWGAPPLREFETGRQIYECDSITGFNRIPINVLGGYVLAGAAFTSAELLPLSPEEIATTLLIDGSWLEADGIVQHHISDASKDQVEQWIEGEGYNEVTRITARTPDGWVIQTFQHDEPADDPREFPADAIRYHYNPLSPTGVLLPAAMTFARLEEIADLIRDAQRGPGAKTAIGGFVRNRNLVETDLMSNRPYVFTGSELPLDRMTSTAVVDQLVTETKRLEPKYTQLCNYVDTTDPIQRPSGADRELVLGPMMKYVAYVRAQMTAVLGLYGASWTYEVEKIAQPAPAPGLPNQTMAGNNMNQEPMNG